MKNDRRMPVARIFSRNGRRNAESGVTFIELLITITILLVGLLGALGFMVTALAASANAQRLVVAKDLASDTMEQIFSMRDNNSIGGLPDANARNSDTFQYLANGGSGIFMNTFQTIKINPGPDQIRGTLDDNDSSGIAIDPRFLTYRIRVLVSLSINADGTTNNNAKRVRIEVEYPLLNTGKRQLAALETYVAIPPRI